MASIAVLREPLPTNRAKLEELIALAEEHVGNCQSFYHRIALIQRLQLDILKSMTESDAPYIAFLRATSEGEITRLKGHYEAYLEYVKSEAATKTTCPHKDLLCYLNLDAFRCEEEYVEKLQQLQASLFAAGFRCKWEHELLCSLADNSDLPDADFDEPTQKKFREWQAECEAVIRYYRAWRDAEVEFVEAFIAEAKTKLARLAGARLTLEQANEKAMQLAEADPQFIHKTQRQWARAIGCATGQIAKLPLWREVAKETGRDRTGKRKRPRVVSLTERVLAKTADPQAELNRLVAEQRRDDEPSPLEEERPRARVRHRKKL
jgi:hypothetical protein